MLKRKYNLRHDCLVCVLRPLLFINQFSGITIEYKCAHMRKFSSRATFQYSYISTIIAFMVALPLCIKMFTSVNLLLFANSLTSLQVITIIADISFYFGSCVGLVLNIYKREEKITELNGLVTLITNRKVFGVSSFFNSQETDLILKYQYIALGIVAAIATFHSIQLSITSHSVWTKLFEVCVIIISNFIAAMTFLQITFTHLVYQQLFQKVYIHVKLKLAAYERCVPLQVFTSKEHFLIINIKKFRRLITSLILNYEQLNEYMNPSLLFWWITRLITLVLNTYLIVWNIISAPSFSSEIHVRTVTIVVAITAVLFMQQSFSDGNQELLSFLYLYPVSILSPDGAAQVEMLIKTLNSQKPILRASDFFTISTHLLASISGTVVTYVLVALQFQATWEE